MKTTEKSIEKLIESAVRMGHNKNDARGIIERNFDYLMRAYPNASKKELVNIAYVIF